MTITRMQRVVVDALEDIKAQDIRVYDTSAMTELFDRVVVATATSNRQTRALAHHVRDTAKSKGYDVISTEGEDTGEWVLVDLGDIVVHIMQPAIRQYYNLEELWGGKPVRMRIGAPATARASARAGGLKPSQANFDDASFDDDDGDDSARAPGEPASAALSGADLDDDGGARPASGSRSLKSALPRSGAPRTPPAKRPTTRTTAKKPATRSAGGKTAATRTAGTKATRTTTRTTAAKPATPRTRKPRD